MRQWALNRMLQIKQIIEVGTIIYCEVVISKVVNVMNKLVGV